MLEWESRNESSEWESRSESSEWESMQYLMYLRPPWSLYSLQMLHHAQSQEEQKRDLKESGLKHRFTLYKRKDPPMLEKTPISTSTKTTKKK